MLQHLITHLLSQLVERRLRRDALSVAGEPSEGVWRLGYSTAFRSVWAAQAVLWPAAAVLMVVAWWRSDVGTPMLLAGAPRDAFTQEIEVSAWGLSERRGGQVCAALPWAGVRRIAFVSWLDSYRVEGDDARIRFSMHIRGLPRWKALARRHAPPESWLAVADRLERLDRLS